MVVHAVGKTVLCLKMVVHIIVENRVRKKPFVKPLELGQRLFPGDIRHVQK